VANFFTRYNIAVVDADQVARDVVAVGMPALQAIQQHFGDDVLCSDGSLDRAALRARVFQDEQQRLWLNGLLHPLISAQMQQQLAEAKSPYVIWMVPLLIENQLYTQADRVLVVDLPAAEQISRAAKRDAADRKQIEQIIATQATPAMRRKIADDIIDNSQPLAQVEKQVADLHQHYLALSAAKAAQKH
jgi:dephospho-CoA kinase